MGTFHSMAKDLMPVIDGGDEDADSGFEGYEDDEGSMNAVKGSEGIGIGMSNIAAHSTVIIKDPVPAAVPVPPQDEDEQDIPALLNAADATAAVQNGVETPPPAYSGSVSPRRGSNTGSMRGRSSLRQRQDTRGSGAALREADLGNGVDTIRPVKKVDTAGSLRMSAEFVGSQRGKEGASAGGSRAGSPTSVPNSPVRERPTHQRMSSQAGKAGTAMVDEVILPILQNVSG
jgi:serine/threonine-protein kinase 24/25/MST4